MAIEAHAVLSYLPQLGKGKYLKPSAVCQDRSVPGHEPVKPSEGLYELVSRTDVQVIGVRQLNLAADISQVPRRERTLYRALGTYVHEHRCLHRTVRAGKFAAPRAAFGFQQLEHLYPPIHTNLNISRPAQIVNRVFALDIGLKNVLKCLAAIENRKRGDKALKIQESAENYLEAILMIHNRQGNVRSIDIANELSFSKPSVSVAMKNLRTNGYIEMDKDGFITLLDKGREIAEKIYERHTLISNWLMHMGVSPETAAEDACRIEHVISAETFEKLKEHVAGGTAL